MKTALLATAFMWTVIIALVQFLMGCSIQRQDRFKLNDKMTVESSFAQAHVGTRR